MIVSLLKKYFVLKVFIYFLFGAVIFACQRGVETDAKDQHLFYSRDESDTGIEFRNDLAFNEEFNIYTYRNFYNGGGVGIGDINNDGLPDIYFTANLGSNKLYLNKGNFKFEDITEKAGVGGKGEWATGVSMADVNGDGFLDIYICNSGDIKGDNKKNELFINNGNLTFSEKAAEYGVDDRGYSTHAAFFDYDKDGDLDLYILNNSYQAIGSFNLMKSERNKRDYLGGDKLLQNNNGHFDDVSEKAGIYGSVIGFGLGVTVGDVNKDGWQDIYVSNDFFERDYLYLNNHNGTFQEVLTSSMTSISGASMGADVADINNDAWPDFFVTEMLPSTVERIRMVTTFENWDRYQYNVKNGYYHQFTRNMLQLNNGDGTFSEISRLAGVEATDWSWGALIFDMDNDGYKDIFVANGIYQDLTNQDYLQYVSNEEVVKSIVSNNKVNYKKLVDIIPSTPIPNVAFKNMGNLQFVDMANGWGLGEPGFSNGSAYGDLDNDGDLDLVVNNVNGKASVFENRTETLTNGNGFLKLVLQGIGKNTFATGSKVTLFIGDKILYQEQMPIRGFQSSMDTRINFGLGSIDTVNLVKIEWPDGSVSELHDVIANQIISLSQRTATKIFKDVDTQTNSLKPILRVDSIASYRHYESDFVDFDRDPLMYYMISNEGPRMSCGDVNNDGLSDIYIGGAKGYPGALLIQSSDGTFRRSNESLFEEDKVSEDAGSEFFDADGDGDLDLYVCSGGTEFSSSSLALIDRLYLNNGNGIFSASKQILPTAKLESTSCVDAADFDGDHDIDLFVGVRVKPFSYGVPVGGHVLLNDGKGSFTVNTELEKTLNELGMVTDATWADVDNDKDPDLIVVGEYMPIRIFINEAGKLVEKTKDFGLINSNGWWNRIEASDLDQDGDLDFVIGNHGLNSRLDASEERPIVNYINDFDQNGTLEQILCSYQHEKLFPIALRHDLISRLPGLKKNFLKYESYRDVTLTELFTPEQLANAFKLEVFTLASCILKNNGPNGFELVRLPTEAQLSPIYAIEIDDFNKDGLVDIFVGGNQYKVKPELGRQDASYGLLLTGTKSSGFKPLNSRSSGISINGEIRDAILIKRKKSSGLVVSRNNDFLILLE